MNKPISFVITLCVMICVAAFANGYIAQFIDYHHVWYGFGVWITQMIVSILLILAPLIYIVRRP